MSDEKISLNDLKEEQNKKETPKEDKHNGYTATPAKGSSSNVTKVSTDVIAKTIKEKIGIEEPSEEEERRNKANELIEKYGYAARDKMLVEANEVVEDLIEQKTSEEENESYDDEIIDENEYTHNINNKPDIVYKEHEIYDESKIEEDEDVLEEELFEDDENELIDDTEDDLDEYDDDDYGLGVNRDKYVEMVKSKIQEKIKPVTEAIDLSTFKISNNPISTFKAFQNSASETNEVIADWALIHSGILISMKEFKGYDIEKLNPDNSSRNEYNTFKDIYRLMYNNIQNEDKPHFEQFLKFIKYTDIDNLYFAIYKASFDDKFLTYSCNKCKEVFIEDVKLEELYEFETPEDEEEFNRIYNDGSEFKMESVENTLVQISNDYVVALREPSIFNVIFEPLSLNEKFRQKHLDILGMLTFIETIFYIDREKASLRPIIYKVDEKSVAKTIKNRLLKYNKIITSFTSDQFNLLAMCIDRISREEKIKFYIPERKCPKCGRKIPRIKTSPQQLLFTRRQMAALVSMKID